MEEPSVQILFPGTTAFLELFPVARIQNEIASLASIPLEESLENGEACIQLLEGCEYEFKLHGTSDLDLKLVGDLPGIISFSRLSSDQTEGRIRPGLFVGTIDLALYDNARNEISRLSLEVRSVKLDYRDEYRHMLEDIADRSINLLFQIRAPSAGRVLADPGSDAATIGQQFEFLNTLVGTPGFRDSIDRITSLPHHRMERVDQRTRTSARLRPSRSLNRQIVRGTRRMELPKQHGLRNMGIDSLPEYVTVSKRRVNLDTPENRFVKFALTSFLTFLQSMHAKLDNIGEPMESPLIRRIGYVERTLNRLLAMPFFRGITDPLIVPLSSPVLQRRGGYRELFRAWLLFDAAAKLCWSGGDDVYMAGRRNVAALYEYWVFFRLLDIVTEEFVLDATVPDSLIEETKDGFGLKLKSGQHIALNGTFTKNGRTLRVRFNYNRTFSRIGDNEEFNYPNLGSWTERMRPDYTLSLWPDVFSEEEAERQELIVHIQFDAKYRVNYLDQVFGKSDKSLALKLVDAELAIEEEEENSGTYRRGDLLKMHAYRDAIRRTAGAYVIYPGDRKRNWRKFHEIMPGLGAFPLRPNTNRDDGSIELRDFIREVATHVSDKATLRERESYHRYSIQSNPDRYPMIHETPETIYGGPNRHPPPAETMVLIASMVDVSLIAWVQSHNVFHLSIDTSIESIRFSSNLTESRYLVIVDNDGKVSDGLYEISPEGPNAVSDCDLEKSGYSGELKSPLYLAFDVAEHPDFIGHSWDISSLQKWPKDNGEPFQFTVNLSELMRVSISPITEGDEPA